jgi:hypothetical protein
MMNFLTYIIGFKGNPPKDDSGQLWFKLAQWFQRRRFFKKLTDGRRMPSDGNYACANDILSSD